MLGWRKLVAPAVFAPPPDEMKQHAFATIERNADQIAPAEARSPLDLSRETMEKFRGEMRKHYLNRKVRFG